MCNQANPCLGRKVIRDVNWRWVHRPTHTASNRADPQQSEADLSSDATEHLHMASTLQRRGHKHWLDRKRKS